MQLNKLTAISPIDGRYRKKLEALSNYFSEFALIKYRVFVEIQYFIALWELEIPQLLKLSKNSVENIEQIFLGFSIEDAIYIKKIEEKINHDVKAVEYFIKDKFDELGLSKFKEFVHFGLTSQDINNTAIPLILKNFTTDYYLNKLFEVRNELQVLIEKCEGVSVLARTHGQPASPTKLDKEIKVFKVRIDEQIKILKNNLYASKFSGATGNFNAHKVSYPNVDWETFGRNFCEKKLKLHYSFPTTQIQQIIDHTKKIALELNTVGLINIQFAVKDDVVYVIEANPRASRTVPFIAKAYKEPYVNYATKIMLGIKKIKDFNFKPDLKGFAIKQPVFSFNKFPNVNKTLGPEMKSTGESILFIDSLKDDEFYELYSRRKMYLSK